MENKKIDVIVKYFFPVAAGIETNIAETYSVLAKHGWNIDIHTSRDTLTEKNVLEEKDNVRGLNVLRYPFKKFGYFPKIAWGKMDLICLHNFDIFPHLQVMLYILLLKMLGKKKFKVVLTPHGGFNPEWSTFSKIQRLIKRTYHYSLGTWLINQTVDIMRAVSAWEKAEIISKGVRKNIVVMVPNGVEKEAYEDVDKKASRDIKERVKGFSRYIIQVGRVYPIKNYETTIQALALLDDKNLKYVIVGPQDHVLGKENYEDELIKLAKKLGVADRLIFAGVFRGVDKYYIIKHAQMMVHMALWESFCNVVHEGMSQGLVCITSNRTNLPYLVTDGVNGYCLDAYDYQALAEKIKFVLENKKSPQILEIKKRNKKFAGAHSWQNVAEKIERFYLEILTQK